MELLHIWEIRWKQGQREWVYGPDLKSVKEWYLKATECGDLDDAWFRRMRRSEWPKFKVLFSEVGEDSTSEESLTFEQFMQKEGVPGGCDFVAVAL